MRWALRALPVLSWLVLPLPLSAGHAQGGADSSAYLIVRGRDTVQAEWLVREGGRLRIVVVSRAAEPVVREHEIELGAAGTIDRMQVFDVSGIGDSATRTLRATIHAVDDSTVEDRASGTPPRLATAGRTHLYNSGGTGSFLYSVLPVLAELAPGTIGDSVIGQHVAGTLGARAYVIRRDARDQVSLGSRRTGMMRVRTDSVGRAFEVDAMGSSFNVVARRTSWMDRDAVWRMFAEMERTRPMGVPAPRDSAVVASGDTRIVVDYGRPSVRGRTIFGGIVPWDQVWRTGANLATHLTTTHPLAFGATVLPAGQYTLWTLPGRDGWMLIVNGETGQWGTDHDPARDIARIPLRLRTLANVVEQFTIAVELEGSAGMIRLLWDTTEASAPFLLRGGTPAGASPSDAPRYPLTADVESIDGIVRAFYDIVSGPAGEVPDRARDESLHAPDARIRLSRVRPDGAAELEVMDLDQLYARFYAEPRAQPFHEREIHRVTKQFGNIAHVWSTYVASMAPDGPALFRGITSMQLYHDGTRWWITGWMDENESDARPIPAEYLPPPER